MLIGDGRVGDRRVDVRIEHGLIAEVGKHLGTPDIDLAGRWLIPGLWDHHVHFTQWTLTSQRIDLSSAASAVQAAELLRGADGSADIVIGANFRDGLWPDAPSRAVLDGATGAVPAVLVSGDLHCVWLNSAALARFGHPEHPTGLLVEEDAFAVERQIAELPEQTVDSWARQAAAAAAARGVVGIVDYEMAWNREHWQRRIAAGHDGLRVEFGIYREHLDRAIAGGMRTGEALHELLTVGRFKILTDGSLNTRTAYIHGQYPEGGSGLLTVPPDELTPLLEQATAAGIESAVHALGDAAVTLALQAMAATGARGSIEHAQLVADADFARFGALGIEASVQPEHLLDDREVAERHWSGNTGRAYAFRGLLDAGATLRFGSDAPVAPLDPWLAISAALARTRDERPPWHPEQRITAAEALTASTRTSITVGEPADLVATELDPLSATGEQLRTMPVAATLLGGRITHSVL